jgi:probable HAF family extracellular repeat protein
VTTQPPILSYSFAAMWSPGQGWQDLHSLIPAESSWTLAEATAINDRGDIVGYGTNAAGRIHAYLLTPNPSVVGPASSPLMAHPIAAPAPGCTTLQVASGRQTNTRATDGPTDPARAFLPISEITVWQPPIREVHRVPRPAREAAPITDLLSAYPDDGWMGHHAEM